MNEQEDEGTGAVEMTEPSEAAMVFVRNNLFFVNSDNGIIEQYAQWFDRFAQQAVEARVARIVAALDEWRKPAIFGAEEARRKHRYDLKREFNLIAEAYDKAIAIARGEEEGE